MGPGWGLTSWKAEKDLGDLVEEKQMMHPHGKAGQQHLGMGEEKHCHQVEGGDASALFSSSETCLECCVLFYAPQHKGDMDILQRVQQQTTKIRKGLKHLSREKKLKELALYSLGEAKGLLSMRINA